jgi:hypothetical protein
MKEIHQTLVPGKDMSDEAFAKMPDDKQRGMMEREVLGKDQKGA